MKTKAVSLLSGGLDSAVATALAAREHTIVLAVTFDYGQRAGGREIAAAAAFCKRCSIEHLVIALPWLAAHTATALVNRATALPQVAPAGLDAGAAARADAVWVPNRNGVFVAIAAALAEARGADAVIAGFNAEEAVAFPDNGPGFVDASNVALAISTRSRVRVKSPTLGLTKDAIARAFVNLDLDPAQLWCCYEGKDKLCGQCESCARTLRAFDAIGALNIVRRCFQ